MKRGRLSPSAARVLAQVVQPPHLTPQAVKVLVQVVRLADTGREFTSDDVRSALEARGAKVGGPEIGAAMREASVSGLIRGVGIRPSTRRGNHGRRVFVWVGTAGGPGNGAGHREASPSPPEHLPGQVKLL